jgi:hypothetical protein
MTITDKITTSIISAQCTLNHLEEIKHTPYYKKELKNKLNLVLPELIKAEKTDYDSFFNLLGDSTSQVYDVYNAFLTTISKVPIYHMENIINIVRAYEKDKKSIEGIVNKILR